MPPPKNIVMTHSVRMKLRPFRLRLVSGYAVTTIIVIVSIVPTVARNSVLR